MLSVSQLAEDRKPPLSFARYPAALLAALGRVPFPAHARALVDRLVLRLAELPAAEQAAGVRWSVRAIAAELAIHPTAAQRALTWCIRRGLVVDREERARGLVVARWFHLAHVAGARETSPYWPGVALSSICPRDISTTPREGVHSSVYTPRGNPPEDLRRERESDRRARGIAIDLWYVWTPTKEGDRRVPLTWLCASILKATFGAAWCELATSAELVDGVARQIEARGASVQQWTRAAIRAAIERAQATASTISADQAAEERRSFERERERADRSKLRELQRVIQALSHQPGFEEDVKRLQTGDDAELELLAALVDSGDLEQLGSGFHRRAGANVGRKPRGALVAGDAPDSVLLKASVGGLSSEASAQAVPGPQPGPQPGRLSNATHDSTDSPIVDGIADLPVSPDSAEHQADRPDDFAPSQERGHGAQVDAPDGATNADQSPGAKLIRFAATNPEHQAAGNLVDVGPRERGQLATAQSACPSQEEHSAGLDLPVFRLLSGGRCERGDHSGQLGNPDRRGLVPLAGGLAASKAAEHVCERPGSGNASQARERAQPGNVAPDSRDSAASFGQLDTPERNQAAIGRPSWRRPERAPGAPGVIGGTVGEPGLRCVAGADGRFDADALRAAQERIKAWRNQIIGADSCHPGKPAK